MKRVFLAGTFHETHSFTDDRTGFEGFKIHRGKDLLDRYGEGGSQVDGFLTVAAREGWEVVPAATYTGGSSGMVDQIGVRDFLGRDKAGSDHRHRRRSGCHLPVPAWRHGDQRAGRSGWRIAGAHPGHSRRAIPADFRRLRSACQYDGQARRAVGQPGLLPRMSPHRMFRYRRLCDRVCWRGVS